MRQPITGEHQLPIHRVPWMMDRGHRRLVENVLFTVVLVLLFGSTVRKAHHHESAQSCQGR
jgi:hypothetical protein